MSISPLLAYLINPTILPFTSGLLKILLSLPLLVAAIGLQAQTNSDSSQFSFELMPIFGFDRLIRNSANQKVYAPQYLIDRRREHYSTIYPPYVADKYVDFPQTHWSFFGGVDARFKYRETLALDVALIGENRSSSAGVLGFDSFVVFPRLTLSYAERFDYKSHRIGVKAEIGDLINYRNRAGLIVYNLDVQGGEVQLKFDDFYVAYTSIGDLSQFIGLSIHEWASYRLGFSREPGGNQFAFDAGAALDIAQYFDDWYYNKMEPMPALYFLGRNKSGFSFYGELGYRSLEGPLPYDRVLLQPNAASYDIDFADQIAAVAGIKNRSEIAEKHQITYRAELRYYGKAYTKYYFDYKLPYQDGYGKLYGDFIYPLMNAYRSFNQFAVFSEFQDMSVLGLNLQVKSLWTIFDRIKYRADFELLTVHTLESTNLKKPFPYFFYETGLVIQLSDKIEGSVFFSNKVKNLDLSYQTFYQSQLPMFGYAIRSELPLPYEQAR